MNYKYYIQNRKEQGFSLNIGKAISDGFSYFGKKPGPFILYLFVFFGISIMASFIGLIPVVGSLLVAVLISPPLVMGFATYMRKVQTNDYPVFEDFFGGFKTNYTNLALVNLVIQGVGFLVGLLVFARIFGDFEGLMQSVGGDPDAILDVFKELQVTVQENILLLSISGIGYLLIYIFYSLSNYFVIFYGFNFWEALESSRILVGKVFFSLVGLIFVTGVLLVLGIVLTLGLGLLIFIPVLYLISYSAFEQIAGFQEPETEIEDDLIL